MLHPQLVDVFALLHHESLLLALFLVVLRDVIKSGVSSVVYVHIRCFELSSTVVYLELMNQRKLGLDFDLALPRDILVARLLHSRPTSHMKRIPARHSRLSQSVARKTRLVVESLGNRGHRHISVLSPVPLASRDLRHHVGLVHLFIR